MSSLSAFLCIFPLFAFAGIEDASMTCVEAISGADTEELGLKESFHSTSVESQYSRYIKNLEKLDDEALRSRIGEIQKASTAPIRKKQLVEEVYNGTAHFVKFKVRKFINKYDNVPEMDAIQVAVTALYKAIDKFKLEKRSAKFTSFLGVAVDRELKSIYGNNYNIVDVKVGAIEVIGIIKHVESILYNQAKYVEATAKEIAEFIKTSVKSRDSILMLTYSVDKLKRLSKVAYVEKMLKTRAIQAISNIKSEDDEGGSSIFEVMESALYLTPEHAYSKESVHKTIVEYLSLVQQPRYRFLIKKHYGIHEDYRLTLEEIEDYIGVFTSEDQRVLNHVTNIQEKFDQNLLSEEVRTTISTEFTSIDIQALKMRYGVLNRQELLTENFKERISFPIDYTEQEVSFRFGGLKPSVAGVISQLADELSENVMTEQFYGLEGAEITLREKTIIDLFFGLLDEQSYKLDAINEMVTTFNSNQGIDTAIRKHVRRIYAEIGKASSSEGTASEELSVKRFGKYTIAPFREFISFFKGQDSDGGEVLLKEMVELIPNELYRRTVWLTLRLDDSGAMDPLSIADLAVLLQRNKIEARKIRERAFNQFLDMVFGNYAEISFSELKSKFSN